MTYFLCLGCFCLGCLYTHFRSKIHYYCKYFLYIITHFRAIQKSSYYNEFTETNINDTDFTDLNGKVIDNALSSNDNRPNCKYTL